MNLIQYLKDWADKNPGKAIGALTGFFIAILILMLGIINVFLMIILVGIGYFIGKSKDDNSSFFQKITDIYHSVIEKFKR